MRGCCQSFLIDTNDGPYVVKFRENPEGYRALVNELISSTLLRALGVSTPATALVHITQDFLAENTVVFLVGSKEAYPGAGLHFGSRHPGQDVSVYDILPAALLKSIRNRDDFFGALVFDSWISNRDFRQAVFVRTAPGEGFQASMIDHSKAFDGSLWSFTDGVIPCLSCMRELYESMTPQAIECWLARVEHLPTQVILDAAEAVPEEWIQGDRVALDSLLEALIGRQRRIGEIIDLWLRGWLSRSTQRPV
jgi:hypothetical protein